MNHQETATVCYILASTFPTWKATDGTIEMWSVLLADVDSEIAFRAAQDWTLTEEKLPTLAGVRKKCAEINGSLAPTAFEAWREVNEGLNDHGREFYKKGNRWSHPLIEDAVQSVGFLSLCFSENIGVERAHFLKAYNELKENYDKETITSIGFQLGAGTVSIPSLTVVKSKTQSLSSPDESDYIDG
jgi:hypothetical protein